MELEKLGYTNLINVTGGIKAMDETKLEKKDINIKYDFHCANNE